MTYHDLARRLAEGHDRTAGFVREALVGERPLRDDWRDAVADAASEIDRIATSDLAHPDDVIRARTAMGCLAGLWLTVEEHEALDAGEYYPA